MGRTAAVAVIAALLSGCTVSHFAEIDRKTLGVYLTCADELYAGENRLELEPVCLMQMERWGLRILGAIPVGSATLRATVNDLAEEAKRLDVDYIVRLEFETYKASFPWCLLNWYTSTTVKGMGMRKAKAPPTPREKR